MADSIYTFDPVPANNTALDSIPYGPNQLYHNQIDNWFRALGSKLAQFVDDLGAVNAVAGTGDAVTVTLASGITAYATGQFFRFIAGAANTGAATMNVNSIGAKAIRKISGGTDIALSAGDIAAGETYLVRYSTAANAAAGAWIIVGGASVAAATTSAAGIVKQQFATNYNLGIACSVGASALTIALKDAEGNDPSSSSPVIVPFRNVTPGTGTPSYLTVTAATSLVISSGSTLGAPTGSVPFKVWIVAFNDGGTFRLGAMVATTVSSGSITQFPLGAYGIASSTAEGGAGAADSAQTFYTGTAATSKAYAVLAVLHFESGLATAGTWASAPTRVELFDAAVRLPGTVVQYVVSKSGATATGTTILPNDDTIPQITEGVEFMTQAITPSSAANLLAVRHEGYFAHSAVCYMAAALFQDATSNALAASMMPTIRAADDQASIALSHNMIAATTSSTTLRVRAGGSNAGTIYFNGNSGGRKFGGALSSTLTISEIAA
jgi:predicted outer membrane repeat protein